MQSTLNIVNKSGAWFAYNGDKIGQGRENAKNYLTEHPDIMEETGSARSASTMHIEEQAEEEEEQTETPERKREKGVNDSHQSGTQLGQRQSYRV